MDELEDIDFEALDAAAAAHTMQTTETSHTSCSNKRDAEPIEHVGPKAARLESSGLSTSQSSPTGDSASQRTPIPHVRRFFVSHAYWRDRGMCRPALAVLPSTHPPTPHSRVQQATTSTSAAAVPSITPFEATAPQQPSAAPPPRGVAGKSAAYRLALFQEELADVDWDAEGEEVGVPVAPCGTSAGQLPPHPQQIAPHTHPPQQQWQQQQQPQPHNLQQQSTHEAGAPPQQPPPPQAAPLPPRQILANISFYREPRRLSLTFNGSHPVLPRLLQGLPCLEPAPYGAGNTWLFDGGQLRVVEKALRAPNPDLLIKLDSLDELPGALLAANGKHSNDEAAYDLLPEQLERKLMAFQREGIKFGLRNGGRMLLGDEMGLGKTVQACGVAYCYKSEWPCLVICPPCLREAWAVALHQWLAVKANDVLIVLSGKDSAKVLDSNAYKFLIVSYDFAAKLKADLLKKKFKVIIVDESHYIKTHSAARSKATVELCKKASRVLLLSGTPALSRSIEMVPQLQALLPAAHLTLTKFSERYCSGNKYSKHAGAKNSDELHQVLTSTVMIRREKKNVLTQLPSKRRQKVYLPIRAADKARLKKLTDATKQVRQVLQQAARVAGPAGNVLDSAAHAGRELTMQLYRETAAVKAESDLVKEHLTELLLSERKFLVFGHHRCLLDAVQRVVEQYKASNKEQGLSYIRITGETPTSQRQAMVEKFQEEENCRVAILGMKAAGVGLTLTAASIVVFAELDFVPGTVIQAEDRAHRIGQASSVNVYFLLVPGSIDDVIWEMLETKLDNVGQVLDGSAAHMDVVSTSHQRPAGQASLTGFIKSQTK